MVSRRVDHVIGHVTWLSPFYIGGVAANGEMSPLVGSGNVIAYEAMGKINPKWVCFLDLYT